VADEHEWTRIRGLGESGHVVGQICDCQIVPQIDGDDSVIDVDEGLLDMIE
jgi:hypothetical protein